MSLGTILLIVLLLMLIGAIPTWSHSRSWGYGPSGGLGLVPGAGHRHRLVTHRPLVAGAVMRYKMAALHGWCMFG